MKGKDFTADYLNQMSTKATAFSMNQALTMMMEQCEKDASTGHFVSTFTNRKLLNPVGIRKMLTNRGFKINEHDIQHDHDEYSFTLSWDK